MKYFLGLASNYSAKDTFRHLFAIGTAQDSHALRCFLAKRYQVSPAQVALTKNGRSAIAIALRALVPKHSKIIVNGFTCQAVVEAVLSHNCTPIYADITSENLHFDLSNLKKTLRHHPDARAIIVQNTLGYPVDTAIFDYAKKHHLAIVEDLAHSVTLKYPCGQLVGCMGDAVALSFGKGKAIDCITGGAVVLRSEGALKTPLKRPLLSETLRARWYPIFAAIARFFTPTIFAKIWLGALIKLHFIERSADSKLDTTRRLSHWQARLALKNFQKSPPPTLRHFALVQDRAALLQELARSGYFFSEIWYDVPISPARYYSRWHFPEKDCPVSTEVSQTIINIPTIYPQKSLAPAIKIIRRYQK